MSLEKSFFENFVLWAAVVFTIFFWGFLGESQGGMVARQKNTLPYEWPDLVVESAGVSKTGQIMVQGVRRHIRVNVVATIANRGKSEAKNVGVRIEKYFRFPFAGHTNFKNTSFGFVKIPYLAPGERKRISYEEWVEMNADVKFLISVNSDKRIPELTMSNNSRFTKVLSLINLSNVTIMEATFHPSTAVVGRPINMMVRVKNGEQFDIPAKIRITIPQGTRKYVLMDGKVTLQRGIGNYRVAGISPFVPPQGESAIYVTVYANTYYNNRMPLAKLKIALCRLNDGSYKLGACSLGTVQPNNPTNMGEALF